METFDALHDPRLDALETAALARIVDTRLGELARASARRAHPSMGP